MTAPAPAPLAPAEPRASTPRALRLPSSSTIIACVAVMALLTVGLDAWRTWAERDNDLAAARVETANLARSLAQHVHDMLGTADTLLVGLRETVEADGTGPAQRAQLQRQLGSQIATVPMMQDLMVFDAAGDRLVNSGRPAPEHENVADRAYFQHHAASIDRDVFVGPPVQGKLDGTWILTLSRRVEGGDGRFEGVVVATFSIEQIRRFYATFDVGRDGFIGLNTTDGVIFTRYPVGTARIGQTIAPSIIYKPSQVAIGNWQSISPVDGVEHLGSFRRVEGYNLVVVVGRGVDELLAPWATNAVIHTVISLCGTAVIALLGFRFARQLRLQREDAAELERRERRYRLLADNNTDLIAQLDAGFRHVYVSPASQRVLGHAAHDMLGTHVSQFAHPDDAAALEAMLAAIAFSGSAPPIIYRARHRDGSEVWIEASGQWIDGGSGLVLVERDITQRRGAERQLSQAQRMEAVGQLTAGVAHDFNNLLQAQMGALELLLPDVADRPGAARFANMALGAAEHAAKLTHSLLSFSRQQVLDPEPVPIPALLARLETILSRTLGPRIDLTIDVARNLPAVFADPAQLEAALLNLSLNARDAMPDGGRLTIKAHNGQRAPDRPDTLEPGRYLVLAVADNGTGMDADTLAQACEPFFTTKGVGKGSGLGLSMVQGFVRQSGGALRAESAPGQGTRMELWLPVADALAADERPASGHHIQGAGRVLLVDDLPEVLLVMAETLEARGFDVVRAASGEEALRHLAADPDLDALVTDFAMPGVNGGELAQLARAVYPRLPIVVITGYAETEKLLSLAPGTAVLRKPITGETLANRLCDLLRPVPDMAGVTALAET